MKSRPNSARITAGCLALVALSLVCGCAAFRVSIREQAPEEAGPLTAKYDQSDLLQWGTLISQDIVAHPFPAAEMDNPILVVMGIQNRTKSHMDMKPLEDTIQTSLLDTRKVQFVNADRRDELLREQGYQLENCTPETRAQIGKQLGAKYMLTGALAEIETRSGREVRVSKKQDVYYQLTVEVTDLETGLIAVKKQRHRLRRASRPLIGW